MSKKLPEFIRKNFELAASDFDMIQSGDRIMVGISGGVDSFVLLKVLSGRKIYVPSDISILAVYIDLGFFGDNTTHLEQLEAYLKNNNYQFHIERTDIGVYAHSEKNRKNPCFLCSRWRRKKMIELADEFNCNKIALGHHKDDVIETLLLNIFFSREISTMMPNQELFKGKFHIIRPLIYLWERKIKQYAELNDFPAFENPCPSATNSKRIFIKKLLAELQRENRQIKENIFKSLRHVKGDYLWEGKS